MARDRALVLRPRRFVSCLLAVGETITLRLFVACVLASTLLIATARAESSSQHSRQAKPGLAKTSSETKRESLPASPAPEVVLISPEAGSIVKEASPTFRWRVSNLPKGQKVSYSLRVVEVLPEQNLQDALQKNPPVLERKNLTDPSFQVLKQRRLATGKIYAMQVAAFGPTGTELSRSGASFFSVNSWPSFCFLIPPAPTIDFCVGQSFVIAYALSPGGGPYHWTLNPGGISGTSPINVSAITIPAGSITASGVYTLTVTAPGCPPQTAPQIPLTAHQPPVAGTISVSTTGPQPICPGDAAVLTLNGSSGQVQWYSSTSQSNFFNFTNMMLGAVGNTVLNTNNLSQTTYYGVMVSSPNGGPCLPVSSSIVQVSVKPPPVPPVITAPPLICVGGSATIQVTSASGNGTYQWICKGAPCGAPSTAQPTSMTVTDPGNYALEFDDGCSTVSSNIVTIQPDLLAVTISAPCCVHKKQMFQLCAQPINGTGGYQYQWTNSSSTTACLAVKGSTTTTYTVIVTDSFGCHVKTSFTVTVCP